ncbi:MAG: Lrp/AsnC ligand binding domain-containing protein [Candidatus Bathyarchaeia archaeon]
MVSACILICCEAGRSEDVIKSLEGIGGVQRSFRTLGRWDIVADVEVGDMEELKETCFSILKLDGIRATETLVEA